MKSVLITILLGCCLGSVFAQNIHIRCSAPAFAHQRATLYTISDYFSYRLQPLQVQTIADNGSCVFTVHPQQGFKAFIQIQDKRGYIYIDPGTPEYTVFFPAELDDDVVKRFNNNTVRMVFDNLPKDDLNTLVMEFNLRLDHFLYGDSVKIQRLMLQNQAFRDSLAAFTKNTFDYYKPVNNRYFNDYMKYSIASIALFSDREEPAKNKYILFESFIKGQPILYHNDAYMNFIMDFYKNILSDPNMAERDRVTFAINNLNDSKKLHEALEGNYYLRHPVFREFILLNGFKEAYHTTYFNRSNMQDMLLEIAKQSATDEHRKIAKNILHQQSRLLPGAKSPTFSLTNLQGEKVQLDSLKGKYVYINFWATWNAPSVQDLLVIKMLYEKYNKYVTFISISLDEDVKEFKKFVAKRKDLTWHICHYEGDGSLLNDFDIRSIPLYALIDDKGNFDQFPALAPSPTGTGKSIDETLHYIKRKLEPQSTIRVGQ
jgi:thiol-disulfide isomerase/thioredoxin